MAYLRSEAAMVAGIEAERSVILTLCAWCGKRCTPDGEVSDEAIPYAAQISHGICRACRRKFFPEVTPWR